MRTGIKSIGEVLQTYYTGFYINTPGGNNAFSYEKRKNKLIYVPPVLKGDLDDLAVSQEIAFSEIVEGKERNSTGLKYFLMVERGDKHIFICDNHNHAFFFWMVAFKTGAAKKGPLLVHIDQHTDLREPPQDLPHASHGDINLEDAFRYTNWTLNVGNFIKPALNQGLFKDIEMVTNREAFGKSFSPPFFLDLDMDIFAPDMDYIDKKTKINHIWKLIEKSRFITIATSPFFMDQKRAVDLIKEIFHF